MTTNCISEPKSSYHDRIWTTGEVGLACFSAAATLSAAMPHRLCCALFCGPISPAR